MTQILSSFAFLESLFSYLHGKAGEAGYDDQRPAMMAGLLTIDPNKVGETMIEKLKVEPANVMLMEANDIAAIFSAHLHGNVHSGVTVELESKIDDAEEDEDELNTYLEDLIRSGRVSLTVDPKREDLVAYFDHLKSVPGGLAFLASIAIHLHHGRRSKRAAVHLYTIKES